MSCLGTNLTFDVSDSSNDSNLVGQFCDSLYRALYRNCCCKTLQVYDEIVLRHWLERMCLVSSFFQCFHGDNQIKHIEI